MTTVIDKNGDGLPDLRAVMKEGFLSRYSLEDPRWIELESTSNSEQEGDGHPANRPKSK
jgi:hypothetical protein